ncbi:MAG: GntR family transcriptional regulator [Oscillospiraceae bacterium]|nr:GntR family transcriptional regulator [Oscillospiraceae bacterium]
MRTAASPQYMQIASDIAARIARGDLQEGSLIYGRSVMASEYSVSPETIRRSLHLLADMKVVEIKHQTGVRIISADNARRFIANLSETSDVYKLRNQLQGLLAEYQSLNERISDTVTSLLRARETYAAAHDPLPNYEVPIPADSPVIGKSIGSLNFWQNTGATIIGIRRGKNVIVSPGPYAELYGGDVLLIVGSPAAVTTAQSIISAKEESYD